MRDNWLPHLDSAIDIILGLSDEAAKHPGEASYVDHEASEFRVKFLSYLAANYGIFEFVETIMAGAVLKGETMNMQQCHAR